MKSLLLFFIIITTSVSTMAQQKAVGDSIKKATAIKTPPTLVGKGSSQLVQPIKAYKAVPYWKKIIDSLKAQQNQINTLRVQSEALSKDNTTLRKELKAVNDSLVLVRSEPAQVVQQENIQGDKTNVIFGIIGFLAVCLGIISFLFISAKKEATYRIGLFEDLSKEYQSYKLKANEKEKKLSRELQTERNRLEELLNNR
ncbi:MAG: hypothetical protein JWQ25_3360 [Daejeonella sp.]|nr:hypothetical protein [Daejeonella sp.]